MATTLANVWFTIGICVLVFLGYVILELVEIHRSTVARRPLHRPVTRVTQRR